MTIHFSLPRWLRGVHVLAMVSALAACTTTSNVAVVPPDAPDFAAPDRLVEGFYILNFVEEDVLVTTANVMGAECEGLVGPVDFRAHFQRVGQAAFDTVFTGDLQSGGESVYVITIRPRTLMGRVVHLGRGYIATQRRAEASIGGDVTVTTPSGAAIQFEIPIQKYTQSDQKSVEFSCDSGALVFYDAMNGAMGLLYQAINDRLADAYGGAPGD